MRVPIVALVLLSGLLAGCTSESDDTGDEHENHVALTENEFDPTTMAVAEGTTITFENTGQRDHTVTIHFAPEPVDETQLDDQLTPGQDTSHLFAEAGTYHVWCTIHGQMTSGMAMVVTVS